ncbi:hypothetical protein HN011_011568 [Eciton burchellii]|nr:hypothetical protein HN011_011568 [Eciton burchellii]
MAVEIKLRYFQAANSDPGTSPVSHSFLHAMSLVSQTELGIHSAIVKRITDDDRAKAAIGDRISCNETTIPMILRISLDNSSWRIVSRPSSHGIPSERQSNARTLPFSNTTFFFLIANNARRQFRSVNGARSRAQQQQQSRDAARVHVAIFGNAACRRGPTGPLPSPKGRLLRTLRAGCEISLREGQPCLITAKCLFISSLRRSEASMSR